MRIITEESSGPATPRRPDAMPTPTVIAIDLETTGLDVASDRVVEVGAIAFDGQGRDLGRFETLVRPGRPMGATAVAVSGIRDEDLADAPPAVEVLPELLAFLARFPAAPLIAHNAAFDAGFLGMELARAGLAIPDRLVLDTLALARGALGLEGGIAREQLVGPVTS